MFNFKNSNSGKIKLKLLATLLVITLTFANFALVGSYIGESIAVEINSENQEIETITVEDIELSQAVITNKIFSIDGANKRVVQLALKSKIKEGKLLAETSTIEVTNPVTAIETNLAATPEERKVALYSTNKTSEWTSKLEDGKITIQISNSLEEEVEQEQQDSEDIFVVTYIYDENVEISAFISNVKNTIKIKDVEETIEHTNRIELKTEEELQTINEIGSIVNLENNIPENIYKGKMYLNQETNYQTIANIFVPYSNAVDGLIYTEELEELEEGINTYFKTTKINREDAIRVLGEEGTIRIMGSPDETTDSIVIGQITTEETIDLSEETEEEYYTISYSGDINQVIISMTSSKLSEENVEIKSLALEGTIEIINEKAIKVDNAITAETIEILTELKSNSILQMVEFTESDGEINPNIIDAITETNKANLLEPVTTYKATVDKDILTTETENDLRITLELIAQNESNKLFKGTEEKPVTINVELPAEITDLAIENITEVIGSDELERTYEIKTNEAGNNVIAIRLTGEQTEYSENSSTITMDLKLKTNNFLANKETKFKITVINDGEIQEKEKSVLITSRTGLLTKSTINNVEKEVNKNQISINAKVEEQIQTRTQIINNYKASLLNAEIIGTISEEETLKSAVTTNIEGAVIEYSEETNPNESSWKTDVTDFTNIKTFRIKVPEFAKAQLLELNYVYELKETATEAQESTIKVIGTLEEEQKQETITYTVEINKQENVTSSESLQEEPEEDELVGDAATDEDNQTEQNVINIEIEPKTNTNTIHEGQIITYNIKVKNNSSESVNNAKLKYIVPQGAVVTELTYAQGPDITFTDNNELAEQVWDIETLAPNSEIEKEVTIKVKEGATTIANRVVLTDEQEAVIKEITTEAITVNNAELTVRLSRRDNYVIDVSSNSSIRYIAIVTNNTNKQMENIKITSEIPEYTTWQQDSEYNTNWAYNQNTKEVTYTIDKLAAKETKAIWFEVKVDDLDNTISELTIPNSIIVKTQGGEQYESNIYNSFVQKTRWDIKMTATHSQELKEGDNLEYIIEVTNTGSRPGLITVEDVLPDGIQLSKVTHYINENNKTTSDVIVKKVEVARLVNEGETLTIKIEAIALNLDDNITNKEIENVARIKLSEEKYIESEKIVNTIINDVQPLPGEDPENPDDPQNPADPDNPQNPNDPENPDDPTNPNGKGEYSISGLAWLDENKDGIRNNNEKILQAIKVKLLNNRNEKIAEVTTSLTGTYKFSNLPEGEYLVVFEYDIAKYAVAKYQVSTADEKTNSDVISKELKIDEKTAVVAVTDTIKISNKDITNIDMGLIENAKFDVKLEKYITKVILIGNSGTKTYEYEENTNLAKVEISAKTIEGTVVLVEYELKITNEGEVDAYIEDVVDYYPEELVFTSETNEEWYEDANGVLHNKALSEKTIKPGETNSVKLVLTKTLKSDSTGIIENIGEIGKCSNLEGLIEHDSTPGNKEMGEDDMSNASLIISISTGSPILYIGIVLGSMLILGFGIYIINKKVLRVRI